MNVCLLSFNFNHHCVYIMHDLSSACDERSIHHCACMYVLCLRYCSCQVPATERTVSKATLNQGRTIKFCGNEPKQCDFFHMLPFCFCGKSAEVARKRDGGLYYRCGSKRGFCDFKDWNGPTSRNNTPNSSPLKRKQPSSPFSPRPAHAQSPRVRNLFPQSPAL